MRHRSARLLVDAGAPIGRMRPLQGAAGMPAPAAGAQQIPDLLESWRAAEVGLVRSYDWLSRLDTVDNPSGIFPNWAADPDDPASYNFAATDSWVSHVRAIGADIVFTIASAVPSNKRPADDLSKYATVVENLVRHYVHGWGGGGFHDAVTWWEFGDQPDFGTLHFDGTPLQFYEMYAAAARAVKRVDAALRVGGPCIAFPLDDGPYVSGFLEFVRQQDLPLDFLTWMWFTDSSRDPLDYPRIGRHVREQLDRNGFRSTDLLLAYWNMTGIPNTESEDAEAAAFQAAAAVYMQDSDIDRAILFRADTGIDLHYSFIDPAGIFAPDGSETARTRSFRYTGRTLAAQQRLAVVGGDDRGFAVLAGRTEAADVVRILIANYAIPSEHLTPQSRDTFDFQVPVGSIRQEMSFSIPKRRTDAASAGVTHYQLDVVNLPWGDGRYSVERRALDSGRTREIVQSWNGKGGRARFVAHVAAPAVELVEIRPILASSPDRPTRHAAAAPD